MSHRRFHLWLTLAALLAGASFPVRSAGPAFTIASPPAWVHIAAVAPPELPANDAASGSEYLLLEKQVRVTDAATERYFRRVRRILSAAGLKDATQLQLEFEPSYQKLIIHHVRIHRAGQVIDALRPREIKLIQQESELDEQLYNGTLSAVVFLHDVRVGDTIDYAYSVNGENPILGGRFADILRLGSFEPVQTLRCRLLWPAARALQMRNRGTDLQPVLRSSGQEQEYLWERRQVPALEMEDATPDWFDPLPRVQLSEFASWEDVARWAVPLYAASRPLSPALTKQIERWRAELAQPEERFLAALRFVQDEIRYLGIELGTYSHQPHAPSTVFARRFGDCKDKTLLLVVILNALGIEAYPALVNTETRHTLRDWQPSPFAFDHVIAQVTLAGRTYWVDPTASLQRGGLAQLYNPDYGLALVVREGSRELQEIPQPDNPAPGVTVKEVYTADSFDQPARLEIVTTYRGGPADGMRHQLAQQSLAELGRSYLNYYAERDPAISADGPPQVSDDPQTNTIVITERYRLPDFWRDPARHFIADQIHQEVDKPRISRRSMPLAVSHPVNIAQTIEIHVPAGFGADTGSGTIENEALRFEYRHEFRRRLIRLDYRFQTRRDHVPAEQVAKHLETLDRIQQTINYQLTRGDRVASQVSAWVLGSVCLLFSVGLIALGIIGGVRWSRSRQPQREIPHRQRLAPGTAPETAIRLLAGEDFRPHLRARRCACGALCSEPDAPLEQEGVIFDGRRLVVVQLQCAKCGASHGLYFDPSPATSPG
jgi:transglutaminase-like putative cysteine protease